MSFTPIQPAAFRYFSPFIRSEIAAQQGLVPGAMPTTPLPVYQTSYSTAPLAAYSANPIMPLNPVYNAVAPFSAPLTGQPYVAPTTPQSWYGLASTPNTIPLVAAPLPPAQMPLVSTSAAPLLRKAKASSKDIKSGKRR